MEIDIFNERFFHLTDGWTWEVEGFLDKNDYVHPIDTDTKVISTVFERMSSPAIRSVAKEHGYIVENANQTTYPDFTLTNPINGHRIALDIKTTYQSRRMVFTLGGYNSFIRNNTKNILYPYDTYSAHWVLGFVYKQNAPFLEYDLDSLPVRGTISCPYDVVGVFVREKHELCGLRAGSGNTKNIGSFVARLPDDFRYKSGPFSTFKQGKIACDRYWANYEKYLLDIYTEDDLLAHPDFREFHD